MQNEEYMELDKAVKRRYEYVSRRLKRLMNEDKEFQVTFREIFDFYKNKVSKVLGTKVKSDEFLDKYFDYVTDLFFQGYYLVREMVDSEDVAIGDRFFKQPDGIIKEQLYDLLNGVTGDLVQNLSHEDSANFESSLIQENEEVQMVLMQVKKDIACIGALKAILDEREKKAIKVKPEFEDLDIKGLLARTDDLFFVDPQKYLICLMTDTHSEIWDLCLWSSVPAKNRKIGEVHVSVFEPENINKMIENLPYYQGLEGMRREQKGVSVTLSFTDKVDEKESPNIISNIVESIKNRLNVGYNDINVTVVEAKDLGSYKYNPETIEAM